MKRNRLRSPFSLSLAVSLILFAAFTGWLSLRATATQMLSSGNRLASIVAGDEAKVVLQDAMGTFAFNKGVLPAKFLPAVKRAAESSPLDARPYLLVGSDLLNAGQMRQGIAALEAGRRLDPRQRWIHLLLLNQYLRSNQFERAADEFAVLARLVGPAQGPIGAALAQMSVAPQTRNAVRRTLQQDINLERAVLSSLASGSVEPAEIFAMASPTALATAAAPGSWGPVLVDRLVARKRFRLARQVWQRINRLSDQDVAPLLYDSGLRLSRGGAPFNWTMASNNVAAAEVRSNKLEVDYYGRETGELISQLLVLRPGRYRFGHVLSGSQQEAKPALVWSVTCENQPEIILARQMLPPVSSAPRRIAFGITVPATCPAQRLRLTAMAGEFPVPVSATIERLQLQTVGEQ